MNDSGMVPVSLVITGITFAFMFHIRCISAVSYLLLSSPSSSSNGVEKSAP
jgi:hypothetical protein